MKVLSVLGSPRRNGNTAKLQTVFEGALAPDHRVEHIELQGLRIAGCRECLACRKGGELQTRCSVEDDMTALYASVLSCDALVLAMPVFMWSYTAQAKAFLDRLFALDAGTRPKLLGKKTALILSGGGDAFDGADLIVAGFMKFAAFNGMQHIGQVVAAPMEEGVIERYIESALKALAKSLCTP